jgi:hypothetical protein
MLGVLFQTFMVVDLDLLQQLFSLSSLECWGIWHFSLDQLCCCLWPVFIIVHLAIPHLMDWAGIMQFCIPWSWPLIIYRWEWSVKLLFPKQIHPLNSPICQFVDQFWYLSVVVDLFGQRMVSKLLVSIGVSSICWFWTWRSTCKPHLTAAHSEFFSNFIKYASVSHNPVLVVVGCPFLSYKFPHLHMYLLHVLLESRWSLACWFLKPHTHPYQFLSGCYGSSFHFRVWHLLFPAYLRSFWDFQYCCSILPCSGLLLLT